MYAASSSEPLQSLINFYPWGPKDDPEQVSRV